MHSGTAPRSKRWRIALSAAALLILTAGIATADAKSTRTKGGGGQRCHPRQVCAGSTDTTPPKIEIGSPAAGSIVPGDFLVAGVASDAALARVEVRVDGGLYQGAEGTESWQYAVTDLLAGEPGIDARATDTAGNQASASVAVTVEAALAEPDLTSTVVPTGSTWESMVPLGRGRMAERGGVIALLYHTEFSHVPSLFLRDSRSGAEATLELPADSTSDWWQASYAWTEQGDVWILSGGGPLSLRRYALSGSSLPTSAALLEKRSFGDGDSRPGDLLTLPGGGVVVAWHQQGTTTPQGHSVAYRSPATGTWSTISYTNGPTKASKDVLVRHPADGSVWLFGNPDGWSSITAARFEEAGGALSLTWKTTSFIGSDDGQFDADPENPDLAVSVDAASGEIVLAYQSAQRMRFSSTLIGSYPVVARIDAAGGKRFTTLPVYVERVSSLGLVVAGADVWLAYRPVDPEAGTFDELWVARLAGGAWTQTFLGTLYQPYERIGYGLSLPSFSARMADDRIHLYFAG